MGITVLGDIIAILKHAKQVQSQLTSDRALNQSQKQGQTKTANSTFVQSSSKDQSVTDPKKLSQRESRAVMIEKVEKSTCVEISKDKEGYTRTTSSVAKRLGPPAAKMFEKSQPQPQKVIKKDIFSKLVKKHIKESKSESREVEKINRLPQAEKRNTTSNGIRRQRLGAPSKTTESSTSSNIIRLKPSASESSLTLKKPSEKTHDKRVSFGDKKNLSIEENQGTDVGKRKKYVMVTTKIDGTKVKEYLDPDDPRISEIGVTRKLKPSPVDSDNTLQRKSDSNEPYKNMRITLSGGPSVTRNLKDIAEDKISAANKASRDLRQRITSPDTTADREPISWSKFSSRIQSISTSTREPRNVKDRISNRLGNSSSHVKPTISRIRKVEECKIWHNHCCERCGSHNEHLH